MKLRAIFFLFIEFVLLSLAIFAAIDDAIFLLTRKSAVARIITIEKKVGPKPYKVGLSYFNEYERKEIVTHINNIEGTFGGKLIREGHSTVSILYKKYFPKEVYIEDYAYPKMGLIFLYVIFILIMLVALKISIKGVFGRPHADARVPRVFK